MAIISPTKIIEYGAWTFLLCGILCRSKPIQTRDRRGNQETLRGKIENIQGSAQILAASYEEDDTLDSLSCGKKGNNDKKSLDVFDKFIPDFQKIIDNEGRQKIKDDIEKLENSLVGFMQLPEETLSKLKVNCRIICTGTSEDKQIKAFFQSIQSYANCLLDNV